MTKDDSRAFATSWREDLMVPVERPVGTPVWASKNKAKKTDIVAEIYRRHSRWYDEFLDSATSAAVGLGTIAVLIDPYDLWFNIVAVSFGLCLGSLNFLGLKAARFLKREWAAARADLES